LKEWTRTLTNELARTAAETLIAFIEEEDDLPPDDEEHNERLPGLLDKEQ